MGWIKRNLFFVIGGVLALGLLGAGGLLHLQGLGAQFRGVGQAQRDLRHTSENLQQQPCAGQREDQQHPDCQGAGEAGAGLDCRRRTVFPTHSAHSGGRAVTSEALCAALRRTIDQLQHEADNASVTLPPKYDFSFSAQRSLVKFAAGSLEPLAVQLGEVKAIAEIFFAARVNALDSIQRVRVSDG